MPIPQVPDRIKDAPALALRALFAGIGQVLLAADKIRARALDQVATVMPGTSPAKDSAHGNGQAPAAENAPPSPAPPATQAPGASATSASTERQTGAPDASTAGPVAPVPRSRAAKPVGTAKPRGTTAPAKRPATPKPSASAKSPAPPTAAQPPPPGRATPAPKPATPPAPKPATPPAPTSATPPAPTSATPPAPKPATSPAPGSAEPLATEPATPPAAKPGAGGDTGAPPIPGYDNLTLAALRARMRGLDAAGLTELLVYERAHAGREQVIGMYERRLEKLRESSG
jgi:hypothetical protein